MKPNSFGQIGLDTTALFRAAARTSRLGNDAAAQPAPAVNERTFAEVRREAELEAAAGQPPKRTRRAAPAATISFDTIRLAVFARTLRREGFTQSALGAA